MIIIKIITLINFVFTLLLFTESVQIFAKKIDSNPD